MARYVKTGELFATFNFDGKDCSDMGIYNISNGGVYTANIEPTFSDSTLEVPNYDGNYFYGSQITGQKFQFTCFCHDLTPAEYNNLRVWLNPRKIGKLILSDQPYKFYYVTPSEVSNLSAYPLTSEQHPDYSMYGTSSDATVVYTGNFTVTFSTVGPAYGYGLAYFRDDLIYDAAELYGVNYKYDCGLLYKDECTSLNKMVDPNADNQYIPLYNPGTAICQPLFEIKHEGTFGNNSLIRLNNETLGSSTVINLSNTTGNLILDTQAQTITDENEKVYYGRFIGEQFNISPTGINIFIPATYVLETEEEQTQYNSFTIQDNMVKISKQYLDTVEDFTGRYVCTNFNGGSQIVSMDTTNDSYILLGLDDNVQTHNIDENGVEYVFLGSFNNSPSPIHINMDEPVDVYFNASERAFYMYINSKWTKTSLFSSVDEFFDLEGNPKSAYRQFGLTILSLDELTITTGNNIKYDSEHLCPSMDGFELNAILYPKYL